MARQWGYSAFVAIEPPYYHVTSSIEMNFDPPVSALFECAMTRFVGQRCDVYIGGAQTVDGFIGGDHDLGFWNGVTRTWMGVYAQRGSGGCYCRGRIIIREYDTSGAAVDWSQHEPSPPADWHSFAYDPKTGAILHTHSIYGLDAKRREDMEKGAGDDIVSAFMRDTERKEKFKLFSTSERLNTSHGGLLKFDQHSKSVVASKISHA